MPDGSQQYVMEFQQCPLPAFEAYGSENTGNGKAAGAIPPLVGPTSLVTLDY
ncbi:hypothetical protein [uncultured Roseibium sp.]|uniref:hypothetical protein n=1 Tax=uncultured Roseibium sp. TaxID=1936171 RepID=UPI00261554D7|nr:hypothetical protein [uncultured Roseibium sp.]